MLQSVSVKCYDAILEVFGKCYILLIWNMNNMNYIDIFLHVSLVV